jgi:RNA polymerase sigma-70 factor (ECF subfamily)
MMAFPGKFKSILAAASEGAEWAIEELYREFHPNVLRYLRTQAPADGEDLASQVWIDVAAGLARFSGDQAAFRHWLFTIARRRLVDFRRREMRRRAVLDSLDRSFATAHSLDPELHALDASDTEIALRRVARLPPDQAEVVLLRVLGGLDVAAVAAILDKSPGAVRVLQHRALKRLAEQVETERAERVTR